MSILRIVGRSFPGGERNRNLMQFLRFRSSAPARLTKNEESEGRTHLHFRQLLPDRASVSTLILFPQESRQQYYVFTYNFILKCKKINQTMWHSNFILSNIEVLLEIYLFNFINSTLNDFYF